MHTYLPRNRKLEIRDQCHKRQDFCEIKIYWHASDWLIYIFKWTSNLPENDICFLQRPVLFYPRSQALADSWILIRELSSWKILVTWVWCNPEIVLQECSSSQKFGLRTSQRKTVRTRHQLVACQLSSPIYCPCISNLKSKEKKWKHVHDACKL